MKNGTDDPKFELLGSSGSGDVTENAKAALQGTKQSFVFPKLTNNIVKLLFRLDEGNSVKIEDLDFQFKVVHAKSYRVVTDADGVKTNFKWVSGISI